MNKKSIFLNDTLFLVFTVLSAVAGTVSLILCFTDRSVRFVEVPFIAVFGVFLYISYRKHQKNVMKGLMGAVLSWLFTEELKFTMRVFFGEKEFFTSCYGSSYIPYLLTKILATLTIAAVLILHFIINSDHHSSPVEVFSNKILCLLLVVSYIADYICAQFFGNQLEICEIVLLLFKIFLTFIIVFIEARLDNFRKLREEND